MKRVSLAVFTGLPRDGKTTVCKELEALGCGYVSTDEIRHRMYPGKTPMGVPYPDGWMPIWDEVSRMRDENLASARSVCIDSCAQNRMIRDRFFTIPDGVQKRLDELGVEFKRYLVKLNVEKHVWEDRMAGRGERKAGCYSPEMEMVQMMLRYEVVRTMEKDSQDCREYSFPGVELVEYWNNTPEDRTGIVGDLSRRMGLEGSR
jgi:predicted kinase